MSGDHKIPSFGFPIGTSYLHKFQKELSQISGTPRRNIMKNCENLKEGNSNHHERANISARYNDWKFVAICE